MGGESPDHGAARRSAARSIVRSRASSVVLGALLVLALTVTGMLAYEAHVAARSHRETAERALRDYASVAAWEMVASLGETLDAIAAPTLGSVTAGRAASPFEPPADPKTLEGQTVSTEGCANGDAPTIVAVDLRNGEVRSGTTKLAAPTIARLRDAIVSDVSENFRQERGYALLAPAGAPPVVYGVRVADHGAPLVAYGSTLCAATLGSQLIVPALRRRALLPWDVTGGVPIDSLLDVTVSDPAGRSVWRSGRPQASAFAGQATADRVARLRVAVALRPAAITRLRIGPPPGSRLPLLVTLLVTTIGLLGVAVLQLRREQELARLRNDFVAGVSHELRTPLAQIMLFAETLRLGRARSESERRQAADIIAQEGQRLMQLVENVLHFARSERGIRPLPGSAIALAPLVKETVARFEPLAAAAEVTLESSVDESLLIAADASAIRQVLLNLLDNAVKHGGSGGRVTVVLQRAGREARLTVDDEGPGIRPADRERVWLPFVRIPTANNGAGSGLGLSVVRELVAANGGTTRIEDAPSGGARFIVVFPLSDPQPRGSVAPSTTPRREKARAR